MRPRPAVWAGGFDVAGKEKEIKNLEDVMARPDFWSHREEADSKIKLLGKLQDTASRYRALLQSIRALHTEFNEKAFFEAKRDFRALELEQLFTGRYDIQPAIVSIYPGAGGEDAEDWARMLSLMYTRYGERRGWRVKPVEDNPRSRIMEIHGEYAYGYLKGESGVHRLVRISPFSPKKLRHTSFALVEIVPSLPAPEESKFQIQEKDLKVEFSRSGGPGGQNVNKVETAVRIVHLPTGLAVSSHAERSQVQNRERALSLLKAKLFHLMERSHVKELEHLRTNAKPEWGNQIRSYVLNPYHLVKDHRTQTETAQVEEVLEGDLDKFIEAEVELLKK